MLVVYLPSIAALLVLVPLAYGFALLLRETTGAKRLATGATLTALLVIVIFVCCHGVGITRDY